jgi:hypothetical protein
VVRFHGAGAKQQDSLADDTAIPTCHQQRWKEVDPSASGKGTEQIGDEDSRSQNKYLGTVSDLMLETCSLMLVYTRSEKEKKGQPEA